MLLFATPVGRTAHHPFAKSLASALANREFWGYTRRRGASDGVSLPDRHLRRGG